MFFAWGKYEIISIPILATSSGEMALSWKIALLLASHRPQMWMSGRAFIWFVCGEVDQSFQASSTVLPFQLKDVDVRDFECSQTCLEKTQCKKR